MLLVRVILLFFYLKAYKLENYYDEIPLHVKIKQQQTGNTRVMRYFQPKKYNMRQFQEARTAEDLDNDSGYKRKPFEKPNFRRNFRKETRINEKRMYHSPQSDSDITRSSLEDQDFKIAWKERWAELKQEALSPKYNYTADANHEFAMIAGRPWYKPCGDPNLHDLPWGTCTLAQECDGEYRIYRGDNFCGRSNLVCCSVDTFRYDMNAAFDVSFADTSRFSTSSEELLKRERGSKELRHRQRLRGKKRMQKEKRAQKLRMKRLISRLLRKIRTLLNRAFKNSTLEKVIATTNVKRLIKAMKEKYKEERRLVTLNHREIVKISGEFIEKLKQMGLFTERFLSDGTFRELVMNGTMKTEVARNLLRAYPELASFPEFKGFNVIKPLT